MTAAITRTRDHRVAVSLLGPGGTRVGSGPGAAREGIVHRAGARCASAADADAAEAKFREALTALGIRVG